MCMKRKLIVFCLLLLSVALLLTACGPNNAERYEEAKKLLYNRQYAEAVKAFEELKGYEDSSKYAPMPSCWTLATRDSMTTRSAA